MKAEESRGATEERRALAVIETMTAQHLGLAFHEDRIIDLTEAVYRRAETLGLETAVDYLKQLTVPTGRHAELLELARSLTIGETYFFRYPEQLRALVEIALPACLRARGTEKVRMLSAGCSTGEEPYTVAMLLRSHFVPETARRVEIRACDLNASSLERAVAGRYGRWAMRETSPEMVARFFDVEKHESVLKAGIRDLVLFEQRNVATDDGAFWRPGAFDIVMFRNVSIYFTPQATRDVLARITRSIAPGGYLFLGHSETLKGQSTSFDLRHTHGAFYFQRRSSPGPRPVAPVATPAPGPIEAPGPAPGLSSPRSDPSGAPNLDCGRVLAFLHLQQNDEALHLIEASSPADRESSEVQIMLAVIYTNRGDLAATRLVCERVLAFDDMNAAAHYLIAVCLDQAGDRAGAEAKHRMVIHLDPRFAMPRMQLGLMARRTGDRAGAIVALEQALELFATEEMSRIMLFGGGFSRDALMRLCRRELKACGVAS